jgi:hypothetical protein
MISDTSLKNPVSEQIANRLLGGHQKGVPSAWQESHEDSLSLLSQHPVCARLDFQQWQLSKHSITL